MKKLTQTLFIFIISISILSMPIFANGFGNKIQFQSKDGVIICANFQKPLNNKTTFILLHGLGSTKNEWQSFAIKLQQNGYGFLAYDARGHGESIYYVNKKTIDYKTFIGEEGALNWAKMPTDVEYAINYLKANSPKKTLKIGIIGASLGANVALVYSGINKDISQLVLLSPGLNYANVKTEESIKAFIKRPVFIAASPGDTYAYKSSQILYSQIMQNSNATFQNGNLNQHGVAMFNNDFDSKLLKWINKY